MKLPKKTTNALAGLDWALANVAEIPQQDDEFTIDEFFQTALKSGGGLTREAAYCRVKRMAQRGELVLRKITIDGARCNLYRRP